ncbi:mitochondrial tRNA-specific 2-thiouridylase 1 [Tribolium castaneum]|uniref:tRNA-5-taurinomethyluridine 2-sulfurtransferase n=1 Tax=Tribolium castaneum TaxID=7070 RepID=D6WSD8_TRICA|nr:PREDICTED: mitochondrial tRNA-specific 2-thiouridylase 1 [Tribolium castaneum]EFA07642.2 Mitochondrial tRNA-specific 2-thiouridylase 1-like Protein [Tribolium castaneum]|eukprot:XP_972131.1 PREDICTED: mitochondrial tRNA-specific 2-thiouridylase 1 [Tribolium castaneum]
MLNIRKVVVGISGGVDSAVAALLLKKRGYDIQGVFMQNWDIADEKGYCSADADYKDAALVCDKLDIKLTHVNFVKHYWNEVFSNLIKEYETGNTPNPDVLCNRNIKFNYFYKYARNELGADAIATGHYARTSFGSYLEHYNPEKGVRLLNAVDWFKDQTFFLCQVNQEALQRTMFPLGDLMKPEVKKIARENGLEKIARKKESMGICFIGNRKFQDFIREYIDDKPGDFVDVDTAKVVGQHNGVHQWTLGQRARLHSYESPYFVARKDVDKNIIYVVKGTKHPLLYTNIILTSEPHWIHSQPPDLQNGVLECDFKFQHTKYWVKCQVCQTSKGLIIKVNRYKRAITPGQFAVLSKDGECLGGARIINTGVSHFSLYYLENNGLGSVSHILKKYVNVTQGEDELTDNEDMKHRAVNRC